MLKEELAKLAISFVCDGEDGEKIQIVLYTFSHEVYLGVPLIGRGTSVIGGRKWPPHKVGENTYNASVIRDGNGLAVKTYWPEKSRTSEVEILKKAKKYGEKIAPIGNHIPEMVCHKDPIFVGSSTRTIRGFLGLSTEGSRRLRVIVFRRLVAIRELEERDMLLAYLQCFFCECNCQDSPDWPFDRFGLQATSVYGRRGSGITTSALGT